MLESLSKVVAMLGVISSAILGWLYFVYEPPIGWNDAVETVASNPDAATQTEDVARETLARLTDATQTIADTAAGKGYSDLPPLLITQDPVWVARYASANWKVPGVGQVSIGVNGFNGGRAWIKYGDQEGYYKSGDVFDIPGSSCTITLETVDEPNLRAGLRRTCP
ncbi:hypothetical protein E4Z66_05600 [Aliishimia ponticola]|uniref:Uncharacterized protein n=1 Tax=Aliishimia ponticola TaxID=2499833 RepID=A0A4S4NH84_9RHOB|nr:hypothetical protein [Aliishimia ponticola]THH39032.1 hypothetical protein E4Z66_05600 [Aliishimia ponticola]